jgi:hypothetical protein
MALPIAGLTLRPLTIQLQLTLALIVMAMTAKSFQLEDDGSQAEEETEDGTEGRGTACSTSPFSHLPRLSRLLCSDILKRSPHSLKTSTNTGWSLQQLPLWKTLVIQALPSTGFFCRLSNLQVGTVRLSKYSCLYRQRFGSSRVHTLDLF